MHHDHTSLADDLQRLLATPTGRRRSLRWLLAGAGVAAVPLVGCGGGNGATAAATASTSATTASTAGTTACSVIPEETNGPYPGDGSNSNGSGIANALTLSGIVRGDIRSSVAPGSATASGIKMTLQLKIVNTGSSCASMAGAAVYVWHCDRDGNYSMYSSGVTGENYLRGVQETDGGGLATFTTIFPGCYAGRMPHIHFEVYPSLAQATSASNRVKTSQVAFPIATCNEVYATSGYSSSARNFANMSFASDNVFSDGYTLEMATVTGDPVNGYVVALTVGVAF